MNQRITTDTEASPNCLTLSAAVDEYLIQRFVDRKKYFDAYLTIAKRAWQKIFRNTLYEVQTVWLTMQQGTPYNYIKVPKNAQRIFTVNYVDHKGKIQPLYYNNQINIIPKPSSPDCGCPVCGGDGTCDIENIQTTTKLLFTINGINYYETDTIKICPNGDVLTYRVVPTKKYKDFVGDGGDYNPDYNNDYSTGNPSFSNFEIVNEIFQEKICALETRPCGCVVDTPQNVEIINTYCGCYFPFGYWTRSHREKQTIFSDINSNHHGEVKISEDNTKIYYIPTRHHGTPHEPLIPQYLLLSFQTNGLDCTSEVLVPDYSLYYFWTTLDFSVKRFNSKYNRLEKKDAEWAMNDEENKVILYLNNFNLSKLADIQDAEILF